MSLFFFYFFAFVLIWASLAVILARYPLYSVLALVVVIFSLSSLFLMLEAFFVAAILLLVYAGAVLVFFLFVVMCLPLDWSQLSVKEHNRFQLLGGIAGFSLLCSIFYAFKSFLAYAPIEPTSLRGTIENIGSILFTKYLLPFELTSLLLLIAIFGIVSLAKGALSTGEDTIETGGDK